MFWIRVVKTPLTFLQKVVKVLLWNAIEFTHMPLSLIPEILNSIDMIMLVRKQFGVVNSVVLKLGNI